MAKISAYPDGSTIQDSDQFVSRRGSANYSNLWSTFKSTLKTYFDTLYAGVSTIPGSISICDGRLTLVSGTPVPATDQTAKTTVYFTPYIGNKIGLYDGSAWNIRTLTEISVAVPATTVTPFDIFCYDNAGTPTLETLDWANDTTRATALAFQNGVLVKSGAATRRYLGTGRTTGSSGQIEDSVTKRFLWNYYNRVNRPLKRFETTASWAYTTTAFQQANASALNQVEVVVGYAEDNIHVSLLTSAITGAGVYTYAGIGEDSASAISADASVQGGGGLANGWYVFSSYLDKIPAVGYHYYAWLERGNTGTTFYGSSAGLHNGGLQGFVRG